MVPRARPVAASTGEAEREHRGQGPTGRDGTVQPLYDFCVAYDEELAERLREVLEGQPQLTEKRMFGGVGFLVGGNLAISASGQGGVLVRVDPQQSDRLVATSPAEVAIMRGRPMEGWLRVASEHLRTRRQLARWAGLGATFAGSLPAKKQ